MPLPTIPSGNVASATAGAFEVANSCRFNDGDSAYLNRDLVTPTNADRWTYSLWVKRSNLGASQILLSGGTANDQADFILFRGTDDQLEWQMYHGTDTAKYKTTRVFRDIASWYHLVFTYDSANGTAGDRMRIYVNGTEETVFGTENNVAVNTDSKINAANQHDIGYDSKGAVTSAYFDGYMAEVVFCDGQAYAASDFGEFDEDSPTIWKPKDVSGLTFGNNGFYLDFEDSSNLGNDANGGTDFTEANLAAVDQATDTPTNNFCTLNPLHIATSSPPTFSEGNLGLTSDGSNWRDSCGTIGLTNGRWYFETKAPGNTVQIGVCSQSWLNAQGANVGAREGAQATPNEAVYGWYGNNGTVYYRTSAAQGTAFSGNTWSTEVISVYLDLEDNLIYFAKDNTMENSGTGYALATGEIYFPMVVGYVSGTTYINLGSTGAFGGTAVSSAVADDNGYGAFEFDPSRGGASDFNSSAKKFYAICTKNLAEFGG